MLNVGSSVLSKRCFAYLDLSDGRCVSFYNMMMMMNGECASMVEMGVAEANEKAVKRT